MKSSDEIVIRDGRAFHRRDSTDAVGIPVGLALVAETIFEK
jgi:hypothetical protein